MKIKNFGFHLVLITALALLLQACGAGVASPGGEGDKEGASGVDTPTVLNFGYVGGATKLPADAEGWGFHIGIIQAHLKEHGIEEVNITGFLTGPDLNESLISGRLDVGFSGDAPAINAKAAGAKTRLITLRTVNGRSVLVAPEDGAKSLQDLEGKKVAVVKGSAMHRYLLTILSEAGVNAEVININSTGDSLAALKRGEVDAVATVPYLLVVHQILQEGFTAIHDSASDPNLAFASANVVTESYLEKFPEFPRIWNEAREKAIADLKAKPDEYYAWLAELTGAPVDVVPELYPIENISEPAITDEGVRLITVSKDFLVKEGVAAGDFDVEAWIAR